MQAQGAHGQAGRNIILLLLHGSPAGKLFFCPSGAKEVRSNRKHWANCRSSSKQDRRHLAKLTDGQSIKERG